MKEEERMSLLLVEMEWVYGSGNGREIEKAIEDINVILCVFQIFLK